MNLDWENDVEGEGVGERRGSYFLGLWFVLDKWEFWLVFGCVVNKVEFFGLFVIVVIFRVFECIKDRWMMGGRGGEEGKEFVWYF